MLKQSIVFKGIAMDAFYKVSGVTLTETGSDEEGKFYSADVQVNSYTSLTKEYDLEQKSYKFDNLRENQFTLTACYEGLKLLQEFEGVIDI